MCIFRPLVEETPEEVGPAAAEGIDLTGMRTSRRSRRKDE
jgi:hypothetical protein